MEALVSAQKQRPLISRSRAAACNACPKGRCLQHPANVPWPCKRQIITAGSWETWNKSVQRFTRCFPTSGTAHEPGGDDSRQLRELRGWARCALVMLWRQAPGGGRMEMLVPGLLGCCMGLANLQNVLFFFLTLEQQGLGRFLDPKTCQQPCVHGGPIDAGLSLAEVWGYWECLVKKN